jgi:hypothetical protein
VERALRRAARTRAAAPAAEVVGFVPGEGAAKRTVVPRGREATRASHSRAERRRREAERCERREELRREV